MKSYEYAPDGTSETFIYLQSRAIGYPRWDTSDTPWPLSEESKAIEMIKHLRERVKNFGFRLLYQTTTIRTDLESLGG